MLLRLVSTRRTCTLVPPVPTRSLPIILRRNSTLSPFKKVKGEMSRFFNGFKQLFVEWQTMNRLKKNPEKTHEDFVFIHRTESNLKMAIPFLVVFALPVIGYTVPILAYFFTDYLPETFWTDEYKKKKKETLLVARKKAASHLKSLLEKNQTPLPMLPSDPSSFEKRELEIQGVVDLLCSSNLPWNSELEQISDRSVLHSFADFSQNFKLPKQWLRRNIQKQINFLRQDDLLIDKKGLENFTCQEIEEMCFTRGMQWENTRLHVMLFHMRSWIKLSKNPSVTSANLMTYSVLVMSSE
eukprot:TRINITY_DN9121_c0_g3_i1.p1 TRINITY_DN9121_c0_g3~~TRINITY_DN9121_c0_g3_i1.p1  ORF type:complete len:320 (+),score=86.43 TRINITY_DN9121_c0_g3_i1:71-961(+)